jgi:hypothetical protein
MESGGDTPSLETPLESAAEEVLSLESAVSEEITESGWSDNNLSSDSSYEPSSSSTGGEDNYDSDPDNSSKNTEMAEEAGTVTIGGIEIKLAAKAHDVKADETPMFKKEQRKGLSEDKRNDLFEKATKNVLTKFDLMSMSLKDEDKLGETYNIHILLAKMKAHLVKYDMHDVFTILDVGDDNKTVKAETKNLFTNYPTITEKEVAKSNKWYNTWPEAETYRENLQLTFQFLENNTTEQLWDKCMEAYANYSAAEKGGPLMFLIIMKKLQVDTDMAVQYLQNSVKTLKITNFDGENVSRVVSLIRGAYKRLQGVGASKVPLDFSKQVAMVLQTSTVAEFNDIFSYVVTKAEVETQIKPGENHWPKIDVLLELAESKYLELHQVDKWTGVNTKVNQSVFKAGQRPVSANYKCFNCGGNHPLTQCTVIKDDARIEKNREAFKKAKQKARKEKQGSGNTSSGNNNNNNNGTRNGKKKKWAAPTGSESTRKKIDNKWYNYNAETKRWDVEKPNATPTNGAQPAVVHVAQATPSTTTPSVSTVSTDTRTAVQNAAFSNATHAINLAMRGMAEAYRDSTGN